MGIYYAIAKCFPQGLWDVSYYLYDFIRPYARPARGIPEFDIERCISKLTFDGLMGKGNQLLVTQTIIRIDLSLTLIMTFVLQRSVHDG